MQYTPFQYTDREALITAKWQVGVRNYTLTLALLPFAAVALLELFKWLEWLRLPYIELSPMHFAFAALYLLVILFVLYRIQSTAAGLKNRRLSVCFEGDTLVIRQGDAPDAVSHITRFEDITAVDYGRDIARIAGEFDACCIPLRLIPDGLIDRFAQTDGVAVRFRRWM